MKFDGFLDEFQDLVPSFRDCDATWQIRNVRAETGFALFHDDRVFHKGILFQTGLFENAVKRTNGYVDIWFSRHRNSSAFRWMLQLTVTTFVRARYQPSSCNKLEGPGLSRAHHRTRVRHMEDPQHQVDRAALPQTTFAAPGLM